MSDVIDLDERRLMARGAPANCRDESVGSQPPDPFVELAEERRLRRIDLDTIARHEAFMLDQEHQLEKAQQMRQFAESAHAEESAKADELLERYDMLATAYSEEVARVGKLQRELRAICNTYRDQRITVEQRAEEIHQIARKALCL